jgi:hypothetical protein
VRGYLGQLVLPFGKILFVKKGYFKIHERSKVHSVAKERAENLISASQGENQAYSRV